MKLFENFIYRAFILGSKKTGMLVVQASYDVEFNMVANVHFLDSMPS